MISKDDLHAIGMKHNAYTILFGEFGIHECEVHWREEGKTEDTSMEIPLELAENAEMIPHLLAEVERLTRLLNTVSHDIDVDIPVIQKIADQIQENERLNELVDAYRLRDSAAQEEEHAWRNYMFGAHQGGAIMRESMEKHNAAKALVAKLEGAQE